MTFSIELFDRLKETKVIMFWIDFHCTIANNTLDYCISSESWILTIQKEQKDLVSSC